MVGSYDVILMIMISDEKCHLPFRLPRGSSLALPLPVPWTIIAIIVIIRYQTLCNVYLEYSQTFSKDKPLFVFLFQISNIHPVFMRKQPRAQSRHKGPTTRSQGPVQAPRLLVVDILRERKPTCNKKRRDWSPEAMVNPTCNESQMLV